MAMSAPSSTTTRVPSIGRRGLARGSALGVGLLVAAGAFAPVALADEETTGDTPGPEADLGTDDVQPLPVNDDPTEGDEGPGAERPAASLEGFFGSGKSVGFQVTYDDTTAPGDLDLSGAVFALAGAAGSFSCTTDDTGYCSVEAQIDPGLLPFVGPQSGSPQHAIVPPGDYAVTQTGSPVGLAAAGESGQVHVCGMFQPCETHAPGPVVNDSAFRSPVLSSVEDAITGAPIEGAEYTLTGPAYPALAPEEAPADDEGNDESGDPEVEVLEAERVAEEDDVADDTVADEDPLLQTVAATSDADGDLVFEAWFLPGADYVLTPESTVDGYVADRETTGVEIAPSTGDLPAALAPRLLTPIVIPAPVVPATPSVVPPAPPVTGPAPAAVPAGGGVAPGSARPGRVATSVPAVPAVPVVTEPAAPTTPAAPSTTASGRPAAAKPTLAPQAGAATPELTTVSSNLPDKGLAMALGGLFLIVVLAAIGLVRRHARRRA
jgi:hypothetical protein